MSILELPFIFQLVNAKFKYWTVVLNTIPGKINPLYIISNRAEYQLLNRLKLSCGWRRRRWQRRRQIWGRGWCRPDPNSRAWLGSSGFTSGFFSSVLGFLWLQPVRFLKAPLQAADGIVCIGVIFSLLPTSSTPNNSCFPPCLNIQMTAEDPILPKNWINSSNPKHKSCPKIPKVFLQIISQLLIFLIHRRSLWTATKYLPWEKWWRLLTRKLRWRQRTQGN